VPAASPTAVFFDLDGTILDWQSGMEESWLAVCESHAGGVFEPARMYDAICVRREWFWGDEHRAQRARMNLELSAREIVLRAFADLGLEEADRALRIADDYRARRDEEIGPYPGAIETLRAFRAGGIPLALITNGAAASQRRSIERHALAQYFACVVVEGEFGVGKPDERVFRHALDALSTDPRTTWMVGDNLVADIAVPHALGMHTVWVDGDGDGLPPTAPVRPHRIVRAIAELAPRER
jgi:putative hydrolase of the HAD superfamily